MYGVISEALRKHAGPDARRCPAVLKITRSLPLAAARGRSLTPPGVPPQAGGENKAGLPQQLQLMPSLASDTRDNTRDSSRIKF